MVNHPNRVKYGFTVTEGTELVARFRHIEHAQAFAQMLSEEMLTGTEVHGSGCIYGQYEDGKPTPEFAGREDAVHPQRRLVPRPARRGAQQ